MLTFARIHLVSQDSGCSSGKCDHKKCRGGGHPTIRPVPISTPCATATPSSSIPSVIVSPSPKPDTTTSTSIGTTISTITITATTSSTTASTSTSTTTSTTTSSSTSPPASTYTPAYGSLSYVARRADGQSPEIVTTSFFDKDYDGTLHSASVSLSAFALTEESYLMDFSHSVLVWRSGTAVMRPKDQETKEANGYPYVCSRGETTDQTPHGYPATNLICAASTGTHTYSDFFICASGKLVPGLNACDAGDDPSALLEVVQLPFSH